jgi:hypothetical protein
LEARATRLSPRPNWYETISGENQNHLEVKRAKTALLVAQQQALEERWRVDQKATGAAHDTDKEAYNESA